MVVLNCFVMGGCVWVCVCVGVCGGVCNVWLGVCVGVCMCGCLGNKCTCIYCVFVLFRLCIFILICY